MSNSDSYNYNTYAADCMRLAETEASPVAKTVMLNMALAWVRLAQQKQALAAGAPAKSEARSLEPAFLEETVAPSTH